jgi:prophage maintenance system killer protein
MFNESTIIEFNKIFSNGKTRNKSSLEFALSATKKKQFPEQLALISRAIIVDHVFEDGNKRTAAMVIMYYFTEYSIGFDKNKIARLVLDIAKKNIKDITKIKRMIKNAIR